MAVVANQAVAFGKSMLTACPHLGDVLRPGSILDHELTGSYSGLATLLLDHTSRILILAQADKVRMSVSTGHRPSDRRS